MPGDALQRSYDLVAWPASGSFAIISAARCVTKRVVTACPRRATRRSRTPIRVALRSSRAVAV